MPTEAGEEKKPTDDGPALQVYRGLEVAHLGKGSSQEILLVTGQLPRTRAVGR